MAADTSPWWTEAPIVGPNDIPHPHEVVQTTSVECDYTDPFFRYITCAAACHFVLGDVGSIRYLANGLAVELADRYVVADTRVALFTPLEDLSQTPPFDDGVARVHPLPHQSFEVEEYPQGFRNYFTKTDPPQFYLTDLSTELVVPAHATLPESRKAVLALRRTTNLAAPERFVVRSVIPVLADGRVDMSVFAGTDVAKQNGFLIDVPVNPITIAEAQVFFSAVTSASGVNCGQLETEATQQSRAP